MRSRLGTRNHRRGTHRATGLAIAGPRLNVPIATLIAYQGLLGPRTNQNAARYAAKKSTTSR